MADGKEELDELKAKLERTIGQAKPGDPIYDDEIDDELTQYIEDSRSDKKYE